MSGPNGEGGTFTRVSAGGFHTCAIKTDGSLKCWGNDSAGQVLGAQRRGRHVHPGQRRRLPYVRDHDRRQPEMLGQRRRPGRSRGPTPRSARSPSSPPAWIHTCAIKTAGSLKCWGIDAVGQVSGPNAEGGTFTHVSAGVDHTCAITTAGTLNCWGLDDDGQVSGPNADAGTFTQLSAGGNHTCAIRADGSLRCWGHGRHRAGVGPERRGRHARACPPSTPAATHSCAIEIAGSVQCWGNDDYEQVSGPNADGGTFTRVSAGGIHTCAIRHRRQPEMLGLQRRACGRPRVRAQCRGRHVHPDQRRRLPHVRDHDRRQPAMLGQRRPQRRCRGRTPRAAPSSRSAPAASIRARSRPPAP